MPKTNLTLTRLTAHKAKSIPGVKVSNPENDSDCRNDDPAEGLTGLHGKSTSRTDKLLGSRSSG